MWIINILDIEIPIKNEKSKESTKERKHVLYIIIMISCIFSFIAVALKNIILNTWEFLFLKKKKTTEKSKKLKIWK